MSDVIRAIPSAVTYGPHFGETYFETKTLTWEQRSELKNELTQRGFLVQELFLQDPMQVLIERRVRLELEAEQEKKRRERET